MSEIADMTRRIVERAKKYEHDTIPGDFGMLKTPCPEMRRRDPREIQTVPVREMRFRRLENAVPAACSRRRKWRSSSPKSKSGRLQGFRSKLGRPFAAVLKMNGEFKVEFDFGNDQRNGTARPPRRWISPARNRWANVRSAARGFLMPG